MISSVGDHWVSQVSNKGRKQARYNYGAPKELHTKGQEYILKG